MPGFLFVGRRIATKPAARIECGWRATPPASTFPNFRHHSNTHAISDMLRSNPASALSWFNSGSLLQRSARGTMTMTSRKLFILSFAVLAALTIVFHGTGWTQSAECVPGDTVTVTGTIARVAQRPDGKEWAFSIQERNSEPCRADAVILADPAKPAACNPGRRITGTGKVHLFNKNNPQSQIVYSKSVTCQ